MSVVTISSLELLVTDDHSASTINFNSHAQCSKHHNCSEIHNKIVVKCCPFYFEGAGCLFCRLSDALNTLTLDEILEGDV